MTEEPSYQVVARDLRVRLLEGEFGNGKQLPTEAELAEVFEVSRQTVRRAFQDLVSEGLVERSRGRGTFAKPDSGGYVRQFGSIDDLMNLSADTTMHVVAPLTRRVDVIAAGRLQLPSDVVHEVGFVRSHDDVRFCFTRVFLPPEVASLLGPVRELHTAGITSTVTIIGLLDEVLPHRIGQAQQSISVGELGEAEAEHLLAEPGRPSLRIDRLYRDTEDRAVELAISHFLPEHYSYRVLLRRSG